MKTLKALIHAFKEYDYKSFSWLTFLTVYIIGGISIYMMYVLDDGDIDFFSKQLLGYGIGFFVIMFFAGIDYHVLARFFILIYLIGIALLLICRFSNSGLVYGWAHYDARRWIKVGGDPTAGINNDGFEFQPSDVVKVSLIIFFAKYFDLLRKKIKKIWVLILAIVIIMIPTFLILTQTDLSTSIVVVLLFSAMLFVSGVPFKYLLAIAGVTIPTLGVLYWYVQQPFQVILKEYQQNRLLAAKTPELYPELTYQQTNAASAIKSGELFGRVFEENNKLTGTMYVPVKESDFIFTGIAEEFGFIGSVVVILLFLLLIMLSFRIALRAKDYLGKMIAIGIGSLFLFQVFINIGVVTSLLPNTGIPLPLMSAGLSSLLVYLGMIGMLLNISMQPAHKIVKTTDEFESIND
ncbi:MAG: FtsW/RodA/SpoVE family cell cycle protein [Lachnospiraceae bacterium]|nr:FtsW/RodA/SpoVE family cell cycle protein [Lachnospiraceae bacterium]